MNQNYSQDPYRQPYRQPSRRPGGPSPNAPQGAPQGRPRSPYGSAPNGAGREVPRQNRSANPGRVPPRPSAPAPRSPRPAGQPNYQPRQQSNHGPVYGSRRTQGHAPQTGRPHPYAQGQDPAPRNKGKHKKSAPPKKGGVPKWLLITLDVLIVVIICFALYFIIKPKIEEKNRDNFKQELLDEFEKKKQVIKVNVPKDFGKVTGEPDEVFGLDFVDNTMDNTSDEVSLTYVGRLSVPKIQVVTPLAAMSNGVDYVSLRFGAGLHPDFAGIGEPGLSCVFGHRFLTSGKDFNRLDEVVAGDQFYIDYAPTGKRYFYSVYDQVIIDQDELPARVYEHFDDDRMVLITCHPPVYDVSTERLLVYAKAEPDLTIDIPD
ncbi:MAG: sortase [Eubacteriales bacterium]|nr:sortase [Eubacteriales bacterium]